VWVTVLCTRFIALQIHRLAAVYRPTEPCDSPRRRLNPFRRRATHCTRCVQRMFNEQPHPGSPTYVNGCLWNEYSSVGERGLAHWPSNPDRWERPDVSSADPQGASSLSTAHSSACFRFSHHASRLYRSIILPRDSPMAKLPAISSCVTGAPCLRRCTYWRNSGTIEVQ